MVPLEPKTEPDVKDASIAATIDAVASSVDEDDVDSLLSPAEDDSLAERSADGFTSDAMDESGGVVKVRTKPKVMFPSLDSPRGLRTLLPGSVSRPKKCTVRL